MSDGRHRGPPPTPPSKESDSDSEPADSGIAISKTTVYTPGATPFTITTPLSSTPRAAPDPAPKPQTTTTTPTTVQHEALTHPWHPWLRRYRASKRQVLIALAFIGWGLLLCFILWGLGLFVMQSYARWTAIPPPPGCDSSIKPAGWPRDELAVALEHPYESCNKSEYTTRKQRYEPIYSLGVPESPVAKTCIASVSLADVLHKMVSKRQAASNTRVVITSNLTEVPMSVDLARLRYSLQTHIWERGLDYLCAQHLGVPLCYCLWKRQTEWLDVLGRVNLTCLSSQKMVIQTTRDLFCGLSSSSSEEELSSGLANPLSDVLVVSQRFKHACMYYLNSHRVPISEALSQEGAAVAQDIFLLQRGLVRCDPEWLASAEGINSQLNETWMLFHREHETAP